MHKKFCNFLKSLKTEDNQSLIESIQQGFNACFEGITYKYGKEPQYGKFDQLTAYKDGKVAGRLVIEKDRQPGEIYIQDIETAKEYLRQGVATYLIQQLKKKFPKYKITGMPISEESGDLLDKTGVINVLEATFDYEDEDAENYLNWESMTPEQQDKFSKGLKRKIPRKKHEWKPGTKDMPLWKQATKMAGGGGPRTSWAKVTAIYKNLLAQKNSRK